jgi:hypothetical protein
MVCWLPQVSARVWGAQWSDYDGDGRRPTFQGSVRLDLAEPHMLVPANLPPAGDCRMLPTGSAIQVTGEEKYLDALAPFLRPEGECWVYASLHEVVEQLARSTRTVVEVRIDGACVGQLTRKMSISRTQLHTRQAGPRSPERRETRPGLLVCWWERRAWDSNPRGTSLPLAVFKTAAIGH